MVDSSSGGGVLLHIRFTSLCVGMCGNHLVKNDRC